MKFFKRNPFFSIAMLGMLLAFSACNEGGSAYNQSATANTPTAEKEPTQISQADADSSDIPETVWENREQFEKDGQIVMFTDCGLYKGDTDELTGAKCEYQVELVDGEEIGQWVLLEPKLETTDNLSSIKDCSNLDFNESKVFSSLETIFKNANVWYDLNGREDNKQTVYELKLTSEDVRSPKISLSIKNLNITDKFCFQEFNLSNLSGNASEIYITLSFWIKRKEGDGDIRVKIHEVLGEDKTIDRVYKHLPDLKDRYENIILRKKLHDNPINCGWGIYLPSNNWIILDDVFVIRGNFPMGLGSIDGSAKAQLDEAR